MKQGIQYGKYCECERVRGHPSPIRAIRRQRELKVETAEVSISGGDDWGRSKYNRRQHQSVRECHHNMDAERKSG